MEGHDFSTAGFVLILGVPKYRKACQIGQKETFFIHGINILSQTRKELKRQNDPLHMENTWKRKESVKCYILKLYLRLK